MSILPAFQASVLQTAPEWPADSASMGLIDASCHLVLFDEESRLVVEKVLQTVALALQAPLAFLSVGSPYGSVIRTFPERSKVEPHLIAATEGALVRFSRAASMSGRGDAQSFPRRVLAEAGLAVVPLSLGPGATLGVLAVVDPERSEWTDEALTLLAHIATGLGEQLALRVENARLLHRQAHLTSLRRVLAMTARGASLPRVMRALARHVEQQSPGTLCIMHLRQMDGSFRRLASPVVTECAPELSLEIVPRPDGCPSAHAAYLGESVFECDLHDANEDRAAVRAAIRNGVRAWWSFPVRLRGECVGTIDILRFAAGSPGEDHLQLAAVAVEQARIAIQRRLAEEELRTSEERYRLAALASKDVLWDWRLDRDAIRWSGEGSGRFGLTPAEESGAWARRIERAHPEDRDRLEASLNAVVLGGGSTWNEEYRLRSMDGRYAIVLEKGFLLRDAEGVPYRMVGSLVDETEARASQEKLARAQRLEAVGRLAGSVAHDFNNILSAISGFAELLVDSPSAADTCESVEQILRATHRGSDLTRQLLTFSRRQRARPRLVDPDRAIAETRPMIERLIGRSIRLEIVSKPPVALVLIDPGQLEQVIVNLIVNARDAMPDGGRICVTTGIVELHEAASEEIPDARPGRYSTIRVEDTGTGISEEVMAHMFEPFFTTKGSESGTGLGLATVLGIVQQHGGFVRARSRVGLGTCVEVCLPAHEGNPDRQHAGSAIGRMEVAVVGSREGCV